MRLFMIKAPAWKLAVVFGVAFGIAVGVMFVVKGETASVALLFAAGGALLFGLAIMIGAAPQRRAVVALYDDLPERDWTVAQRAAWRGPVPPDRQVRAVSLRLATYYLDRLVKHRKFVVIVFGLNGVVAIVNFVLDKSFLQMLLVLLWITALGAQVWYSPQRLRARIALLGEEEQRVDQR